MGEFIQSQCHAAVVTCVDYRLHQRADGGNMVADFLRRRSVTADVITRAGGVQDLVRPRDGSDESLVRDLDVAVRLHRIREIHLVNHEDCGAYATFGFPSREREAARHASDLRRARRLLLERFPTVSVHLWYGERTGAGDRFEIRPVPLVEFGGAEKPGDTPPATIS
ncbi:MAG: hypothetical protein M5R36_23915 [Deltaproteobacteria bacterium]|nr:hypothetical protein [Deltaproteobacteria bacterium]